MKKKKLLILLPAVLMMLGSCGPDESSSNPPVDDTSSVVPEVKVGKVTITAAEHAVVTADKTEAKVGDTVTFTIVVDDGYALEYFKVNNVEVTVTRGKASAKMVEGGLTVTYAARLITGNVEIVASEHVTVTADKESAAVGETVNFTVSVDSGYKLVYFRVNGIEREVVDGRASATMIAAGLKVTAAAEMNVFNVTIDENINNGTVTADKVSAAVGEDVTFTITPAAGYVLKEFKVNNVARQVTVPTAVIKMEKGGLNVTATFEQNIFPVQIDSAIVNGTVTADKTSAAIGEDVTFTVTANEEFLLDEFKVNDEAVGVVEGQATVKMVQGGLNVTATFKAQPYSVAIAEGIEHGSVTADKTEAAAGEDVVFTVTADDDYELDYFKVNGSDVAVENGQATVKMVKGGLNVTAAFKAIKHAVTIPSDIVNGTVVADKAEAVTGEDVTFTVTPAATYKLESFKVNDVEVTVDEEGKATVAMVKEGLTVEVSFSEEWTELTGIDEDFKSKVAAADVIRYKFTADASVDTLPVAKNTTIVDLGGKTLTVTGNTVMAGSADQTIIVRNGTINVTAAASSEQRNFFNLNGVKSFDISDIVLTNDNDMVSSSAAFHTIGNGVFNFNNVTATLKTTYAISTNNEEGEAQTFNIKGSEITVCDSSKDNCAVIMNINGEGHVNIENSVITGDRQAVEARTGTWSIKNTVLTNTCEWVKASDANKARDDKYLGSKAGANTWASGNEVPSAAIVIGDTVAGAYNNPASVTLEGVTAISSDTKAIVGRADGEYASELTVDGLTYLNNYGKFDLTDDVKFTANNVKNVNIKEANALEEADAANLYVVHGYVQKLTNARYGTGMIIDDEGNTITMYGGYNAASAAYYTYSNGKYSLATSSSTAIDSTYVGKEVTIIGTFDIYKTTKEITNAIVFVEESDATVSTSFDSTKGTVALSKETGIKTGEEITVTATPIAGYKVASIKVTQYGETIDITDTGKFFAAATNSVVVEFEEGAPSTATKVTFVPSGTTTSAKGFTLTSDKVSIAITNGLDDTAKISCYQNKTMTVSVETGYKITNIVITCTTSGTSKYGPSGFTVKDGTYAYEGANGTWTGEASSVIFTADSQVRMTKIVVTYDIDTAA